MKIKNLKINKKVVIALLVGAVTLHLVGNFKEEPISISEEVVYSQANEREQEFQYVQEIGVPGESFTLAMEYQCEPEKEEYQTVDEDVLGDRELSLKLNTKDLPEGTSVYIENVNVDTTGTQEPFVFKSEEESLEVGAPISNEMTYYKTHMFWDKDMDEANSTQPFYATYDLLIRDEQMTRNVRVQTSFMVDVHQQTNTGKTR